MERSIEKSVGINGHNMAPDVITVQELLDDVPPAEGGPNPLLKVDGKCGPKTKAAIQQFQLKHFGWKLADGRVDPDGPTLATLNEIANRNPTSDFFLVQQAKPTGTLLRSHPSDWFFHIEQVLSAHPFPSALFWFGGAGAAPMVRPARAEFLVQSAEFLRAPRRCTLQELAGPGMFRMIHDSETGEAIGTSFLTEPAHVLKYGFQPRLGMDPKEPAQPPATIQFELAGRKFTEFRGQFQLLG